MTSRFARGSFLLAAGLIAGCGSSQPGEPMIGEDDPPARMMPLPDGGPGEFEDPLRDAGQPRDGGRVVRPARDAGAPGADAGGGRPPPAAEPPAPPAYSHGACPMLVTGQTAATSLNTGFASGEQVRQFRVLVPADYDPARAYPVIFAWHWLNASSGSFIRDGELETAVPQMDFIAVLPDSLTDDAGDGVYQFDWPFIEEWGRESELRFFEDMLACVGTQLHVDRARIYGVGVSAGGLWITYVSTTEHSAYFAAVESLSGGLGEVPFGWSMEYQPQPRKFPALVLWGGDGDWLGLDFAAASTRYRDALRGDGHFVVECEHDSGHAMPPIEPASEGDTRFRPLWQFFLDHPYGLADGTSPYATAGLPSSFPSWCRISR